MSRVALPILLLLLTPLSGRAEEEPPAAVAPAAKAAPPAKAVPETKEVAGMSIVGDHESPKALVIVPWKSSALGNALDVSRMRDDGRGPIDRDVFRRELGYHRIRSETAAAPAKAAQ